MIKFHKNRRIKHISLLTIIISIIIMQVLILVQNSESVNAWYNTGRKGNTLYFWDPETHPKEYIFGDLDDASKESDYGTHDWIAESALRLIALSDNSKYRNQIIWLLNYSKDDKAGGVEYKLLDGTGAYTNKERLWWSPSSYKNAFFYGTPIFSADEKGEAEWLKTRRYAWFLFGSGVPDWDYNTNALDFSNNEITSEKGPNIVARWHTDGTSAHHIHHDYDANTNMVSVTDAIAAERAKQAGNDAVNYLHTEKKYEKGSVCIGAMTHFIADVASPPHTLEKSIINYKWLDHRQWDKYAYWDLKTRWAYDTTNFPNAGPDWSIVDPQGVGALKPIPPETAVLLMAYTTFTAYDDQYMGDNAAPNMDNTNVQRPTYAYPEDYHDRIINLLRWACYYTACALLDVLKRCPGIEDEDTTKDRLTPNDYKEDYLVHKELKTIEEILDSYERKKQDLRELIRTKVSKNWNIRGFAMIAPVLCLVAIPLGAAMTKERFAKRSYEHQLDDVSQNIPYIETFG